MADTAKGPVEIVELTRSQQAAARRAAEARATVPSLSVAAEADAPEGPLAAALVHAAAAVLREQPWVNGAYRDGRLERYGRVNVGVVVDGPETPLAPVVHDADALDASAIAGRLAELQEAAAGGALTAAQLAGATFAIVPAAARRVEPVPVGGHAATLGAGAPEPRAVAAGGGAIAVRKRVELVLACDARALTVAQAAAFVTRVAALLPASRGA